MLMYFMPFYKQKQPFLFLVIRSICARTCMYLGTDLLTYYLTICECKRIPIILLTLATLSELSNKNQIKYLPYLRVETCSSFSFILLFSVFGLPRYFKLKVHSLILLFTLQYQTYTFELI